MMLRPLIQLQYRGGGQLDPLPPRRLRADIQTNPTVLLIRRANGMLSRVEVLDVLAETLLQSDKFHVALSVPVVETHDVFRAQAVT